MGKLVPLSTPRLAGEERPSRERDVEPRYAVAQYSEPPEGHDLREFLGVFRRRWGVILGTVLLLTLCSAIVIFQLAPRYTAEAILMLDTRKTQVVDIEAVVSGLQSDAAVVRSEVELLKSPALAAKVVAKLNLVANKLTNPRLGPPSLWSRIDPIPLIKSYLSDATAELPKSVAQEKQDELDGVADEVVSRLTVLNDGRSYIIKVRFESESPLLAATIANAYVQLYLGQQLEAKFDATRRASDWLNSHLDELRDKVRESDAAVQNYKEQHQLTATKGATVTTQQLSELNSQMILAASDRAQKEANLRQAQEMVKSAGGADAASQVLASPVVQDLKSQQSQLRRKEAELLTRYRPAHPEVMNVHAQIDDINAKIKEEVSNVIRSMLNDVNAARAREASLRDSLATLQQSTGKQTVAEVQLKQLERESEANRTLYENFLQRYKQTSAQEDMQQADARLVAQAQVPAVPTFPKKGMMTALAVILSGFVGVAGAFTLERLDNGFRDPEQIEQLTGEPLLGLVPAVKRGKSGPDLVTDSPISSYAEAIRSIRTALNFSNVDSPPKVVLVTSSVPAEGKSVFAASLATSVARSGGRALIIDCDLRHPSQGKLLNPTDTSPGLLAYFADNVDPARLIQVDEVSKLHYLPVRVGASNPQDLLGSQHMRALLDGLRDRYDLIVLDSPPVLAVSDALVLAHHADATLFLIRWEETPRSVVLGAIKLLRNQGAGLAGFVMSRVNVRKHAKYGYGDSAYYQGKYGNYYGKEG